LKRKNKKAREGKGREDKGKKGKPRFWVMIGPVDDDLEGVLKVSPVIATFASLLIIIS